MPLKNVLKSFPEKSFVDLIDDTPSTEYSATLVARHLLLLTKTLREQRGEPPRAQWLLNGSLLRWVLAPQDCFCYRG